MTKQEVIASIEAAIKDHPTILVRIFAGTLVNALKLLKEQPQIVRCKDCKHRDPEDHKCDCGHDIQWQLPRVDDWFCADGERKDGDINEQ